MTVYAVIAAMVLAMIAIDWWHRRNVQRWHEMASREDNSLAGAMERSRRNARS